MKSLILFGSGGHCKACIDIIESSKEFIIKGIVVQPKEELKEFMHYRIIGNDNNFNNYSTKNDLGLICVGQIPSPKIRKKLFNIVNQNNIRLATVKSSSSLISNYSFIDYGTIIMNNVVINVDAKIGKNCIINTSALIEHDVIVGDHCHISTGVILNGSVKIGNDCFIGSGSIVREGVKIGDRSIVSAGQVVMRDLPNDSILK